MHAAGDRLTVRPTQIDDRRLLALDERPIRRPIEREQGVVGRRGELIARQAQRPKQPVGRGHPVGQFGQRLAAHLDQRPGRAQMIDPGQPRQIARQIDRLPRRQPRVQLGPIGRLIGQHHDIQVRPHPLRLLQIIERRDLLAVGQNRRPPGQRLHQCQPRPRLSAIPPRLVDAGPPRSRRQHPRQQHPNKHQRRHHILREGVKW